MTTVNQNSSRRMRGTSSVWLTYEAIPVNNILRVMVVMRRSTARSKNASDACFGTRAQSTDYKNPQPLLSAYMKRKNRVKGGRAPSYESYGGE